MKEKKCTYKCLCILAEALFIPDILCLSSLLSYWSCSICYWQLEKYTGHAYFVKIRHRKRLPTFDLLLGVYAFALLNINRMSLQNSTGLS